jgi:hypothetical protein
MEVWVFNHFYSCHRADFARKVVILQPIKADLVYESNQYNKGTRCHRAV